MDELIWINGEVMPLAEARISVEDRGFQFADGVYESLRLYGGKPFALDRHLDRLELSCGGIGLELPIDVEDLREEMLRLCERSGVMDGFLYLQVTRGAGPRNHLFAQEMRPTLLFYVRAIAPPVAVELQKSYSLLSVLDERWNRCWIKSIALLAHVLARNAAAAAGADEAAFIEEGFVSECSSSNLFFVMDGKLVTAPVGPRVLPGITRAVLLELAIEMGVETEERVLTYEEAISANEIFVASTIREMAWVGRWDDRTVGAGKCGAITRELHRALRGYVAEELKVQS